MAEIESLNTTDGSNTARFPEQQSAGSVNDGARALEGILARFHEDLGARKLTTGSANAYAFAAAQTVAAYYDGLIIGFDASFGNTGAATLNVDGLGAKTIKKANDQDLASGDIETGQKVLAIYDGTNFQMISQTANLGTGISNVVEDTTPQLGAALDSNAFAINESEGTPVASSATTDIWVTDGNTAHITGTTTITSLGTAPRIGAMRRVIFDGALTLTDGANLNLPGGANITTAADDFAFVYAETTTLFKVLYFKEDGTPVVSGALGGWVFIQAQSASASATIDFTAGIDSTYDLYKFVLTAIVPATDNVDLRLQTDANGGASFDAGGSDYSWLRRVLLEDGADGMTVSDVVNSLDSKIDFLTGLGNAAGEEGNCIVYLKNPAGTNNTQVEFQGTTFNTSNNDAALVSGAGTRLSAAIVNAVRFLMSSGNITSGTFALYGLNKT